MMYVDLITVYKWTQSNRFLLKQVSFNEPREMVEKTPFFFFIFYENVLNIDLITRLN